MIFSAIGVLSCFATVLLFLTNQVCVSRAICNCAVFVNENTASVNDKTVRRLQGCDDNELATECRRAEWELQDYANGVINFAQAMLVAHPTADSDAKSGLQIDSAALGVVTLAVEKYRPVPDCSSGLFTITPVLLLKDGRVKDREWKEDYDDDDAVDEDLCISNSILQECLAAQEAVSTYISNVIKHLAQDPDMPKEFFNVMKNRLERSVMPTISCQTSKQSVSFVNRSFAVGRVVCRRLLGFVAVTRFAMLL